MNAGPRTKVMILLAITATAAIVAAALFLKTDKTNPSEKGNVSSPGNNNLLQTACKNALNDYPEWAKTKTDIIIWENPDQSFNFRNSPEDASTRLTSPVPAGETLADMDFIGLNEISYVTTKNNNWQIHVFKLNGLNPPDKALVYGKTEPFSFISTSPLSKSEYIVLVVNGGTGVLRRIKTDNSQEETIAEISLKNTENLKLAASPKGTYAYVLQSESLTIFEIASRKQIAKISAVNSAVWVGDGDVLYSGAGGTFVYNLKTQEKSKLSQMGSVSALTFNPQETGVIAFNEEGSTKIMACQTGQMINTKQGAVFKTLTSEKTAITQKGDRFGYWRFRNADWDVKILEDQSKFVTIWQRY